MHAKRVAVVAASLGALIAPLGCIPDAAEPTAEKAALTGRFTGFRGPCRRDTVGPTVRDVRFSISQIDVTASSADVEVAAEVVDAAGPDVTPSGVRDVSVDIRRDADVDTQMSLTLGPQRGTDRWVTSWTVPLGSPSGLWMISGASATDRAGNSEPQDPSNWDSRLAVTASARDTTAPVFEDVVLSATAVDTGEGAPVPIDIMIRASDDGQVQRASLTLRPPVEDDERFFEAELNRVADGTFTGRVTVPPWTGSGLWRVNAEVSDGLHTTELTREVAEAAGWPIEVQITSASDFRRPIISRVVVGAPKVDTRRSARQLPVSVRVTDAQSGLAWVNFELSPLPLDSVDEHLYWDRWLLSTQLRLTRGSLAEGVWTGELRVPRCARVGDYRVLVSAGDSSGRVEYLSGRALEAVGGSRTVRVLSRAIDTDLPTAIRDRLGPRKVLVIFDEGVVNVTRHNLPVFDYRPSRHVVKTSVRCQDASRLRVPCNGGVRPVRRAIVTVDRGAALSGVWRVFPNTWGVAPQITDTYGNPLHDDVPHR